MNTRALLIIAKTNWDGAHCYLSYDPIGHRILRPVTFDPGESLANARTKSLQCETPLEIGLWYKFALKESLLTSVTDAVTLLPHKNDDRFVDTNIVRVDRPDISWMPQNFDIMYETQNRSSLFTILLTLAKSSIEEIFHPTKLIDCKYVNKGTDCPSVGVLQCFLGQLGACPAVSKERKPKIEIHDEISDKTYRFPFTAQNADGFANFINSNNRPEEPVLLLFSTGRPWTGYNADEPYDPPRCYVLCVGLVRKYLPRAFNAGSASQPLMHGGYSEDPEFHPGLLQPLQYGGFADDFQSGVMQPLRSEGYPEDFQPETLPPLPSGGYPGEFNPGALQPRRTSGYPGEFNPGVLQSLPSGGFEYDVEEFYPDVQPKRKPTLRRTYPGEMPGDFQPRHKPTLRRTYPGEMPGDFQAKHQHEGSIQFSVPTETPVGNALQEFRRQPRERTKSMHAHKFRREYLSHHFYSGMSMQENRPGPFMPSFRHHERRNSMPELHPYQRRRAEFHQQQFLQDRESGQFTQPFYDYDDEC
ncbi:uncharacterized protein LOC135502061 [Lineus longissimus]|uniref:uncharacterized protein LOC135502061 n=1 Tax=Lineus longissimus TaxID=88925 RepID=UPI00315C8FBC